MPLDAPRALSVVGDNDPDMTVFQQPWWLEAVSDNRYKVISVGDDQGFIWWPYVQDRWCGFSLIGAPPMTHVLGPVIRLPDAKTVTHASQRRRLIDTALKQMPHTDGFQQVLPPDTAHALDFQFAGFELGVRYTYRLDATAPVEELWQGVKYNVRKQIRRAQQNFVVNRDMSLMAFYAFYEANLRSQGRVNHHDEKVYRRLDEALARRDRHRILTAIDRGSGRIAAAAMLIWDSGTLYCFRATQDRSVEAPGASSLLIWEAIQLAASLGVTFDSDGFNSRTVALFVEAVSGAPLEAREFTYEANPWVLDTLLARHPALDVDIPSPTTAHDRRVAARA